MTSAAEAERLTPAPSLLGSIRESLTDLLENSLPLIVPNVVWGAALLMILVATSVTPLAWLIAPVLAVPAIGIFRVAALIVRGEHVSTLDAFRAWARFGPRALGAGFGSAALLTVLAVNLMTGLESGGIVGWVLATFAGWGAIAVLVAATVLFPLLVDPRRESLGLAGSLRLASLLVLAFPLRFGALTLLIVAFLTVSTLMVVVLLSISVALGALAACHYVLPAADRLAARMTASPG